MELYSPLMTNSGSTMSVAISQHQPYIFPLMEDVTIFIKWGIIFIIIIVLIVSIFANKK